MSTYEGYGNPVTRQGKLASDRSTTLPLTLLNTMRQYPIPVTIGGANNVTFTLKGSTRAIPIWVENDLIMLDEDLAYTWNNTSNNILNSSGVNATDTDSVLGPWYMYIAISQDSDGDWQYEIRPSQTAPEATAGPNGVTYLGHPGTSKSYPWRYVGFMVCTTAATPAFRAMVKHGYWYKFAAQAFDIATDSWATPTAVVATLHVPKLAKYGLEIGGTLGVGSDGEAFIGAHTASTIWDAELHITDVSTDTTADQTLQGPVTFPPNDTNIFYAIAAPAGTFELLKIKDIV